MQIGAADTAATDADPDLSGTGRRHIAGDPAQRSVVNRGGVVDNPSFHATIIPRRNDDAAPGLPPGGKLTTGRALRKKECSPFAPRATSGSHARHDFGDFARLARHRLYGSKTTTAAGTTHHAVTDARCNP
jgi:hypothetical protein